MKIPGQLQITLWLAAVVLAVGLISHALDLTQYFTLVVFLVSCGLLGIDWLTMPRNRK